MRKKTLIFVFFAGFSAWPSASAAPRAAAKAAKAIAPASTEPAVLWTEPADVGSRDLYYGTGGEKHAPTGVFIFEKEDLKGSNPKFVVRDQDGVKWKVKLGAEARPETVASRFVWAAGYFADEDYFVPKLQVRGLPARLHRGEKYLDADGSFRNVRLKRYLKGEENEEDDWRWRDNPFSGTRELNGLRVMMALINNWDLKDENNKIRDYKSQRIYLVSDLGASFGTNGFGLTQAGSKGNLKHYEESTFVRRDRNGETTFGTPARESFFHIVDPHDFIRRLHIEWIRKDIPDADCRWIGQVLAQLSHDQIRAAFRAADYTPDEVEAFARVVETRIAQLNAL